VLQAVMIIIVIGFPGLVLHYKNGAPTAAGHVKVEVPMPDQGGGAGPYAAPAAPSFGAPPPANGGGAIGGGLPPPTFGAPTSP